MVFFIGLKARGYSHVESIPTHTTENIKIRCFLVTQETLEKNLIKEEKKRSYFFQQIERQLIQPQGDKPEGKYMVKNRQYQDLVIAVITSTSQIFRFNNFMCHNNSQHQIKELLEQHKFKVPCPSLWILQQIKIYNH